jgi:hypothetical protein
MTHFHADAVLFRMRVSVHHYSDLCPISSGAEFDTIDDALKSMGLHQFEWNPDRDSVRYSFCLVLFSGTFRTGYDFFADVCFRDFRGRFINPDVVLRRVEELIELQKNRWLLPSLPPREFRRGPVPFTGRGYRSSIRRHIKTTAERREAERLALDDDAIEAGIRVRAKRNARNIPSYYDDIYRSDFFDHGWKSNRKTQWRPAR